MRERAQALGAQVFANTEVLGIDVEDGRVQRVRTSRGDVETDVVVIACGVWSPRIARMAGASIPLTPAVHQMIDVGPVPRFLTSKTAVDYPIVRDMDTNMYERQDGQGLEVGSYAHRPILYEPDEILSLEEAALSPTELPFTQQDFEPQLEHALQLVPEILGDESVGIKYAINGRLALTPDGLPILGETREVLGLWWAAVFYEAAAWERPHWYESNAGLVEEYGVQPREHEWDARWWSPIANAEHLAMRERAAMFDLTAFCIFDVAGPGALDSVQTVATRQMNVPN